MEQLWLAFVLKENHGKAWDGDKWLKERYRCLNVGMGTGSGTGISNNIGGIDEV